MNSKKFVVRMGGSSWVCELNAGTLMAFEKLSGKRSLGGVDWIESVTDVAHFLLATMRPQQPELTLEKVLTWISIEEIPLLTLQWDILRGVLGARCIKVSAEVEEIFRSKLGEDFLATLKAEATTPSGSGS